MQSRKVTRKWYKVFISWPTKVIRGSVGFFMNGGNMKWINVESRGGLGVHIIVPGLVKPPSVVKSAVEMV